MQQPIYVRGRIATQAAGQQMAYEQPSTEGIVSLMQKLVGRCTQTLQTSVCIADGEAMQQHACHYAYVRGLSSADPKPGAPPCPSSGCRASA